MDTTKLTLFSLISKGIALKILTLLFLVCNIQVKFNTYYLADTKIDNDEAKFTISKSGVIKVEFGGSPFEFKCKRIEIVEGLLQPSHIMFYGPDSDDKLEISSTGILYYSFLSTPINDNIKNQFSSIIKAVRNKTIFSTPVPVSEK